MVVHAPLACLVADRGGAALEDGGVAHPEPVRRLACDARVQTVIEDDQGQPLALGRISREPSAAMLRQLRYRDEECRFPGCGARQFTQAHHIVWWRRGGTTDLANLVLICAFHHKLVHEHGWGLRRDPGGEVRCSVPTGCPTTRVRIHLDRRCWGHEGRSQGPDVRGRSYDACADTAGYSDRSGAEGEAAGG